MTAHRKMMTRVYLAAYLFILVQSAVSISHAQKEFQVLFDTNGQYKVIVDKQMWLQSSSTFFTINHKRYDSSDNSLKLVGRSTENGYDKLGPFTVTSLYYQPLGSSEKIKVMLRQYRDLPLVLFGQEFVTSVSGCSTKNRNTVSSGFPTFIIEGATSAGRDRELGYLAYGGIMAGDTGKSIGIWSNDSFCAKSGLDSGPLILFDKQDHAVIISPFNNFMALSVQYTGQNQSLSDYQQRIASWGIMGNVDKVPEGYVSWTAVMYSANGINKLMRQWGDVMRFYYDKSVSYTDSDFVNNYIGYWTDNGAYYYYKTEPGLNYQDTIIAVKKYADEEKIPYRYVQYDSWWYHKDRNKGVTEWTPLASVFPRGLRYLWDKTNWPVVAHNRYWSNYTLYARQNGGHYNFIVEDKTKKAIPLDQEFWNDLLKKSKKWGLITYEQDWLNVEFDEMDATVSSLTLGDQWLHQMNDAAKKFGITVMYCMSPARHTLASLQMDAVTQMRVTIDYQPGKDSNWRIGITSMFATALGLAPLKDVFWTTTHQAGNPYNKSAPYVELNSAVATLSTGPVAIGDRVHHSDRTLIMRSCNEDGLILKPSKPVTAINKQLILAAYHGFKGEIWSTHSNIGGLQFGILLAAAFTNKITVNPSEAGFGNQRMASRAFPRNDPSKMMEFSEASPITLLNCTRAEICVWYTSPVLNIRSHQVVILGELDKWVTMSPQRVRSLTVTDDDLQMTLSGAVKERVTLTFQVGGSMRHIVCVMGQSGGATLSLKRDNCTGV